MTNEEAIKFGNMWLDMNQDAKDSNTYQFFIMAIKALEQKPCEDTVSKYLYEQIRWEREVAIKQLADLGYELGEKIRECEDVINRNDALKVINRYGTDILRIEAIKAIPPASTEKTGRWTIKQYQVSSISDAALSTEPTTCKIVYTYTHSVCESEEYLSKYNYCPNCGCRMTGVEE